MPELAQPPADPRHPTTTRFETLFGRRPSAREAARFRAAHEALELRVPARARRRAAHVIARL
jgi:hypothetical protein